MPGGMEFDVDVAEPDFLAIGDRLRGACEILAIAQPHHVERFLRRQHRAMAWAGVVGMAVGDYGALDGSNRIDMEKPPGLQQRPAGAGNRMSCGRMSGI